MNKKQLIFKELFVGTLIYAVVLGFFNDYTGIVYAKSFSTIFLASIVLELLTFATLLLKKKIVSWLNHKEGLHFKAIMYFLVWLVLFLSKFVFLGAIDWIFGNDMNISGFIGLIAIVVSVTVAAKLADFVFQKLGK